MTIIPAIDLLGSRCVRLYQGRFDRETRYDNDPVRLAESYSAAGCEWLHVVDLDGARTGEGSNQSVIARMASVFSGRVQVGGGVRSREAATALLGLGVERVVVGSTAVRNPDEVATWFDDPGPDKIVLAFDVRLTATGTPELATDGWTEDSGITLWRAIDRFLPLGLQDVLCTDISRDGTMEGPNLDLYTECVTRYPEIRWQASGGVRDSADLTRLQETGVAAAITGRALLDGRLRLEEVASF